jgi:3-oxoacyl-[acyl-carrier-protein] synthase II
MIKRRRVVITGLGCITALGESAQDMFDAVCRSESGISAVEAFDVKDFAVRFGGEIKDFQIKKFIGAREGRRLDRFAQFAVASAVQAVDDSGIDFSLENRSRMGVIMGTGIGGLSEIELGHGRLLKKGPRKISPFCIPKMMGNAAAGIVSIHYGLRGPNMCIVTACASASHAVGEAFYNIITDRSDLVITGGSEAALTPVGLAAFCSLRSLSTKNDSPQTASRPFDRDRDGFVLSEGGGAIVIEEYEHARRRNATIYAELLGYGATGDGHHITAPLPDGRGAADAMRIALADGNIRAEQVDYINAHGTSTALNDAAESAAIRSVFGNHADKLAVSSTKGSLGHLLGASGAVELIITAKTIHKGIIPPTANLENVDKKCDPDIDYVIGSPREAKVGIAISNSLGFGGHNCCLALGKV